MPDGTAGAGNSGFSVEESETPVDRDLDALATLPGFSLRRLWTTLAVAAAIIAIGSIAVRTYPNSGYQAGREAVMEKGSSWVRGEVDAARGTALSACDALHREAEAAVGSPRYDYDSFVHGCDNAVGELLGLDVPLLPDGR